MSLYTKIINLFPKCSCYCFAYGSAVKKQVEQKEPISPKMFDFIFCVKDSLQWHNENLEKNPTHYSLMKIFGSSFITKFQRDYGARIYFNTLVPISSKINIKYGVIEKQDLIEDLNNWSYLYCSGRLHKPVKILLKPEEDLQEAIDRNLINALRTSLLLLPEKFTQLELFMTIANLSYAGDFRMIFGENKNKIYNIVTPQVNDFYKLYLPAIKELSSYIAQLKNGKLLEQDKSAITIEKHLRSLPKFLLQLIIHNSHMGNYGKKHIFPTIATKNNLSDVVSKSLRQIIRMSSIKQSLKNIPSAGLNKSLRYSWRKILKTFAV